MAQGKHGAEGLATAITVSGTSVPAGTGETAVIAAMTGGSIAPDASVFKRGARSFLMQPAASGLIYLKPPTFGASLSSAADALFKWPSTFTKPAAGGNIILLQGKTSTGNTYAVNWEPTNGFLTVTSGGALWTSTVPFQPHLSWLRVGLVQKIDTTTPGNSQVRAAVFPFESDTPVAGLDTGWLTRTPSVTGAGADGINAGRCGTLTDTQPFNIDEFRWDSAATDLLSGITLVVSGSIDQPTGASGSQRTYTCASSGGNGATVTYAIRVEYSAAGDFSDTVNGWGGFDGNTYQASPTFTLSPAGTPGVSRFRIYPRAQQAVVA